MEVSALTWILAVSGSIIFLSLMLAQLMMIIKPNDQSTKDLLIGKGEDWRDRTHFKSAKAFAWADWLMVFPLLVLGNYGVLNGFDWGYYLWIALGCISIYFSILFWVLEKEYTFPSKGWFAYYTYYWGFFLYWGVAVVVYSLVKLL